MSRASHRGEHDGHDHRVDPPLVCRVGPPDAREPRDVGRICTIEVSGQVSSKTV